MLIFIIFISLISLFSGDMAWVSISPELICLQGLLLYYVFRLTLVLNSYQLAGYNALTLIVIGSYLFWLQLDAFGCFLIVAESVAILFMLTIFLHLNYSILRSRRFNTLTCSALLLSFITYPTLTTLYSYWVDWFMLQVNQYNDLLAQYLFFYTMDQYIVLWVAVLLLILTIALVQLILKTHTRLVYKSTHVYYTRKTQNIWSQWYKKPFIRFFRK